MKVRVSARARADFDAAGAWYAAQDPDAAVAFGDAVLHGVALLARFPSIGAPHRLLPRVRVLTLTRFPFRIAYRIESDHVLVLAVAHTSRRPDFWSRRR